MTGTVKTYDHQVWQLPVLTEYTVESGDWESCGGFTVRFPADRETWTVLKKAAEFTAEEDGAVVFSGVVDEAEVRLGPEGLLGELTGRSQAARLMDVQVPGAEFALLQLEEVLKRYVRPWGISKIQADPLPPLRNFLVETGDTCWQVLTGFCLHSAGVRPRVLEDGTLEIRKKPACGHLILSEQAGWESASVRSRRYGRLAEQVLVDIRTGNRQSAKNPEFLAQGGWARKVTNTSGTLLRAGWRTGQQRIQAAEREKERLLITLPGGFLVRQGDRVETKLKALGVQGSYWVRSVKTKLDGGGQTCAIELGEER